MTGGSDAERKGHKRKLADALQPTAINTPPPPAGEHNSNSINPQVDAQIVVSHSPYMRLVISVPAGSCEFRSLTN
jgi:hypothetical protein